MARRSRIILGLNSGTSADGVDAVVTEIAGRGPAMKSRVLLHVHRRYPPELRQRILAVMAPSRTRTEEICRLHVDIGRAFARTAAAAVRRLGRRRIDLIGSHGQTVCHLPPVGRQRPSSATGSTMQLGDPAVIAARLDTPVVARFRQADMAVGGQGAPLVPWTDYVLFRHAKRNRLIQNIGGIANLTWLPAGGRLEDVIAFDTGPGNMVIDALVRHFSNGREQYDRNGDRAARGGVDDRLSDSMTDFKFIARRPPKSCGREQYGEPWVAGLLRRHGRRSIPADDWIRSATHSAAVSVVLSYAAHLPADSGNLGEVLLCGGGSRNRTLVCEIEACLDTLFDKARVGKTDDYGVPAQAKECLSFAMLAAACVDRVPANLPRVTGARRAVVLGEICHP